MHGSEDTTPASASPPREDPLSAAKRHVVAAEELLATVTQQGHHQALKPYEVLQVHIGLANLYARIGELLLRDEY